jgi:hypothetical protein
VARDNIWALILESGLGDWIDPSSDTCSDGEMWWIMLCRVGSWDKIGKSWTTGVTELDPGRADGCMVRYMFGQWNRWNFLSAGGSLGANT